MLKSFIYTAERKSLTEAGKILLLPVSSISRYITDLEKDMGKKLINTLKGKIFLTPEGEKLYRRANKLIKSWDSILSDVEIEKKVIRVASYASSVAYLTPRMFNKLKLVFPSLKLDIQVISKTECELAIIDGEVDIGIYPYYNGTVDDKNSKLIYKEIAPYSPRMNIHKDNLFNKNKTEEDLLTLEEIFTNKHLKGNFYTLGFLFDDLIKKYNDAKPIELHPNCGMNVLRDLIMTYKGFSIFDPSFLSDYEKQFLKSYKIKDVENGKVFAIFKDVNNVNKKVIKIIQTLLNQERI